MRDDATESVGGFVSQWQGTLMWVITALFAVSPLPGYALDNGVARTPPMGWNTFNSWGGEWDVARIKTAADAMVSTGLRDVGYVYCNMDGNDNGMAPYWPAWAGFVAWAKPIAEYMHARDLKCGVYIAYTDTAHTMAVTGSDLVAAGIDFLKHDEYWLETTDPKWRKNLDILLTSGWKGVYSIHAGNNTGDSSLCNLWRTGNDIQSSWSTVMRNYDDNYWALAKAGPGGWADPDMLETGVMSNLTEGRSNFSMWCMMASPLIIGYDITRKTAANFAQIIAIFSNFELIAVDQDSLGRPGKRVKGQGASEVWVKDLKDGTKAVAFFNRTGASATITINQTELGISSSSVYVRDLWLHQDQPAFTGTFSRSVASHATEVFRMSSTPISPAVEAMRKMDRSIKFLEGIGYSVFPQRLIPSVLQGAFPGVRALDLRGRCLAVDRRMAGAGAYVLQVGVNEAVSDSRRFTILH